MNTKLVEDIANAVLYEGYLLYPYRPSAVKNRQRWNFGVVYPLAYAHAQRGSDSAQMHTECLVRGGSVLARARFLQLIARDSLDASGAVVGSWQEAMERDIHVEVPAVESLLRAPRRVMFRFAGRVEKESERVVRRTEEIKGTIELGAEIVGDGWLRLRFSILNASPFDATDRESALMKSFVSTHAILSTNYGEFASLLDPPEALKEAAGKCQNVGAYPVLAGDTGSHDAMLCSPIILYDYPQIAPESPGALFDGTEIDEILSLRILTMTEAEKSEMREVDDVARRLLERTESLTPEMFLKMHGTLREAHPAGGRV